jgi:hypothetical protein
MILQKTVKCIKNGKMKNSEFEQEKRYAVIYGCVVIAVMAAAWCVIEIIYMVKNW